MKAALIYFLFLFFIVCIIDLKESSNAMAFIGDDSTKIQIDQKKDQLNQHKIYQQNNKLNGINDTIKRVDNKFDLILEKIRQQKELEKNQPH